MARWLTAGYLEYGTLHTTTEGTPQGAVCSPVLANIALDGLDAVLRCLKLPGGRGRLHLVRYADDFAVMAPTRDLLEQALPYISAWLAERGLELHPEKTRIVSIDQGFPFLGFHLRRYKGKLLIKPQKEKVLAKLREWAAWLKGHKASSAAAVIQYLNPRLRGWAAYYRHAVSKRTFRVGTRRWVFAATTRDRRGRRRLLALHQLGDTPIVRHVMVRLGASPDDPTLRAYWATRQQQRRRRDPMPPPSHRALATRQDGRCPVCRRDLSNGEPLDVHHWVPVADGGTDGRHNLVLCHEACHYNAQGRKTHTLQRC